MFLWTVEAMLEMLDECRVTQLKIEEELSGQRTDNSL